MNYTLCADCGSMFLTEPEWLSEAYASAIASLDVGLLERCIQLANVTTALVSSEKLRHGTFLDFAGGYGTLTRLMRDRGLNFHHNDPMCDNLFSAGFEGELTRRYDLITAFEVLEHLPDPVHTLEPVASATDLLLFTTQVLPYPPPIPGQWEYFAEETGQHITFYTVAGLRHLGRRLGFELTSSGNLIHMFHRRPLRLMSKALLRDARIAYAVGAAHSELMRRKGLTNKDRATAQTNQAISGDCPT